MKNTFRKELENGRFAELDIFKTKELGAWASAWIFNANNEVVKHSKIESLDDLADFVASL